MQGNRHNNRPQGRPVPIPAIATRQPVRASVPIMGVGRPPPVVPSQSPFGVQSSARRFIASAPPHPAALVGANPRMLGPGMTMTSPLPPGVVRPPAARELMAHRARVSLLSRVRAKFVFRPVRPGFQPPPQASMPGGGYYRGPTVPGPKPKSSLFPWKR